MSRGIHTLYSAYLGRVQDCEGSCWDLLTARVFTGHGGFVVGIDVGIYEGDRLKLQACVLLKPEAMR
jgi:hypothetical protein